MFYNELFLADLRPLHADLYTRYMELSGAGRVRQTHYLEGRFENTYVDESDMPGLARILSAVKERAAGRLGVSAAKLQAGFWFNAMGPGQRTLPHHHDENDELLSAVYYIRVPENSGDLILHFADDSVRIRPCEGKLVMFSPALMHEVTPNLSAEMRLSIAINIGPARS